jgi:N-methylhydantoinase A/acetophenone carboxylase
MMEIQALGAGGGSIAEVRDGVLHVGPQSAGALPGPACFNLGGGRATVTDANLVLGVLDPDYFLGGKMTLDVGKARTAIEMHVARPLNLTVEEAAWQIRQTVDRHMGQAVADVASTLPTGQERVAVAYGGAGGLHACAVAKVAGIGKTIITPFSAVSSAYSSSLMDAGHLYHRRLDAALTGAIDQRALGDAVASMWIEARRDMRSEGFDDGALQGALQVFARARGGTCTVMVHADTTAFDRGETIDTVIQSVRKALAAAGERGSADFVLTTLALMVYAQTPHYTLPEIAPGSGGLLDAQSGHRRLYCGPQSGFCGAPVYRRSNLGRGAEVTGPALVESDQTTILVSPGWRMTIDRFNNAILEEAG